MLRFLSVCSPPQASSSSLCLSSFLCFLSSLFHLLFFHRALTFFSFLFAPTTSPIHSTFTDRATTGHDYRLPSPFSSVKSHQSNLDPPSPPGRFYEPRQRARHPSSPFPRITPTRGISNSGTRFCSFCLLSSSYPKQEPLSDPTSLAPYKALCTQPITLSRLASLGPTSKQKAKRENSEQTPTLIRRHTHTHPHNSSLLPFGCLTLQSSKPTPRKEFAQEPSTLPQALQVAQYYRFSFRGTSHSFSSRDTRISFSPTELKVNNNSNKYINNNKGTTRSASAKDKSKSKDKEKLSMTNDTKTSVSEAVVTSDSAASKDPAVGVLALGHEAASSQGTPAADEEGEEGEIDEDEDTSMKSPSPSTTNASQHGTPRNLAPSRIRSSKLSAEDLNGGLLDGALDDDDEDMDGDTEDTEPVQDAEGTPATREADEEEEEGEIDEDHEEEEEEEDDDKPADTEDDTHLKVPKGPNAHGTASPAASEDQDDGSHIGDADADGDVAMTEQEGDENDDDEDEGTPAGQTDDEGSEPPEDDGSNVEDGDEDGEGDGDEDEEDEDDDDDAPATPKKDVASFPQKPTLNRPQLIAEDLKDSGDELSDLSEFDDSDDSDDEEVGRSSRSKGSSSGAGGSAAAASASATATSASATTNSRPSLGGRKRSLREASRETKEQEEKVKKEIEEDEETKSPQSDKESESEMAEEEANEEKGEGEEEREEEEDLEKKQVYTEALEALSSIEVEFAHLRDKMYEERMLELETEVEMINDGTHPELSTLMKEIEDKRDQRLRVARAWRTHMNEISQAEFEIKEYQAHCTFQSKKRELRTDLLNGVGQKQQQLRLELTLSESRARHQPMEKSAMLRARKHKRAMMTELRSVNERYGFPVSNDLRMIATVELDEDFAAMGIPRPVPQTSAVIDHGHLQGHSHGHSQELGHGQVVPQSRMHERPPGYGPPPPHSAMMGGNMSSSRPSNPHRWGGSIEHSGSSGMRPEVEIYEDGSRCKVDGIWYKPNDPVVVLDAALGQYHAKYLFLANDEIMLQKTDGTKTRLHLNLFRGRKLYMQPRP